MEVLLGKSRKIIKLKKNFPARLIWVDGSLSLIQTTTKQTMAYRCCVATGADEKCGATPLFSIDKCSEKAKEFQQFSKPFKGNFSVLTLGIWCSNLNNCHDIKVGTSCKQSAWFSSLKKCKQAFGNVFSQNIAKALFVTKHWTHFTSFYIFPSLPQWSFQDPKMKVLLSCGDIPLHSPYIGLIYGRYLQSIGSWDGQWLPPESYCPNETRVGGGSWLRRPPRPSGVLLVQTLVWRFAAVSHRATGPPHGPPILPLPEADGKGYPMSEILIGMSPKKTHMLYNHIQPISTNIASERWSVMMRLQTVSRSWNWWFPTL